MKKAALIIMLLSIFSKIFGFARDVILSYFYGASNISDAYLIALTIPSVIFSFIGTGIATGYIPMYSKIEGMEGSLKSDKYTNNLVNFLLIFCTAIIIISLIFTNSIVKLFASGFEGSTLNLTVHFTQISLIGIYFTMLISIFNGYLQLKGNFIISTLSNFPLHIFTILAILLSTKYNINILVIGTVFATISQFVIMIPFILKNGYKYQAFLDIRDKHIKDMALLALPLILGVSVNQINLLIDRTLASQIAEGGISVLNYANRLSWFVEGVFVLSIATVMYPKISKMVVEKNIIGLKNSVGESITAVNLLVVPAAVGSIIYSEQIVSLLFGRGEFNNAAINMTSSALMFYSLGMIGSGLREILARTFYSLQDTKTPMGNAVIALVINIILSIILSKFMGVSGLALASSTAAIVTSTLLIFSLRKKIGSFGLKHISINFIKILCSSILMGIFSKVCFELTKLHVNQYISLGVSIVVGVLIYFFLVIFLKIDSANYLLAVMKNKKRGK
ncbi:putative peptidoglycan lipid II flippase [Fictibacillus solisalsi]|uniref:Probable lipid II flippase MurJ n=1 Tax=Fictibacillus solisalsi TaxID=459525 RepID=A0A1G9YKJ0_9BACL|nr:murein biosynthesis integral membrane protein MurJ [Fictibacillus solisalsi]SDN09026.1 putative peptidoglycan lipid II flippase [Fictibacillus solisalsi]